MTSVVPFNANHLRSQYKEVRDALLTLKARYKTRKSEKVKLQKQVVAFQKLVTRQSILIKDAREEISRLEEILEAYRESEESEEYSTFGWGEVEGEEMILDSGIGSSQSGVGV